MRKYIDDLTDNLIGKHKFAVLFDRSLDVREHDVDFVDASRHILEHDDVAQMKPETLGRIMCGFEIGDVMTAHPGKEVTFAGDCECMFREIVALCLAHAIYQKLQLSLRPRREKNKWEGKFESS
ncbi:MAG: hypothetical protein EXS46_03730 [Candidatus Taylorbacteria bacterium]|nr:hypothetical protein [Candidatus Taylorbacteria bacterium]